MNAKAAEATVLPHLAGQLLLQAQPAGSSRAQRVTGRLSLGTNTIKNTFANTLAQVVQVPVSMQLTLSQPTPQPRPPTTQSLAGATSAAFPTAPAAATPALQPPNPSGSSAATTNRAVLRKPLIHITEDTTTKSDLAAPANNVEVTTPQLTPASVTPSVAHPPAHPKAPNTPQTPDEPTSTATSDNTAPAALALVGSQLPTEITQAIPTTPHGLQAPTIQEAPISVARDSQTAFDATTPPPLAAPPKSAAVQDTSASLQPFSTAAGAAPPADQIAPIVMRMMSADGARHISLQLTPDALGRIDIQIAQPQGGNVHVSLTVELPETLALLQQDHSQLTQALDRAGLTSEHRTLSFHLATPHASPAVTHDQPGTASEPLSASSSDSSQSFSGRNTEQASIANMDSSTDSGADAQRHPPSNPTRTFYQGQTGDFDQANWSLPAAPTDVTAPVHAGLNITA